MGRAVLFIVLSLFLVFSVSAKELPVFFFLPHQDDEMILAGGIVSYLEQGREVKVIMVTDGGASAVRSVFVKQGYRDFNREFFSQSRNDEFIRSMLKLGVKKENIIFANTSSKNPKYRDGQLTREQATEVIGQIFERFGDGIYITIIGDSRYSFYPHGDHLALEKALRDFPIQEKHFYTDFLTPQLQIRLNNKILEKKSAALSQYFVWAPQEGKFAIGEHSVASRLRFWQRSNFEYILE